MFKVKYVYNGSSCFGKKVYDSRLAAIDAAKKGAKWLGDNRHKGFTTVVPA